VAECLFCAIVAGEIPATTVLETDRVLAFRDINPQAPTHVLVVPKTHYPDVATLADADAALLGEVIGAVQQVAAAEAVA
jgi:histidine triad (HIT) family protein